MYILPKNVRGIKNCSRLQVFNSDYIGDEKIEVEVYTVCVRVELTKIPLFLSFGFLIVRSKQVSIVLANAIFCAETD